MISKWFLNKFRYIASAPNGVDLLRQLIMSLALTGDLLTADNESLAENFALRLELAKQQYFDNLGERAKPFVRDKPLIKEFQIPTGWRWVRVGEVCDLQTGATPSTERPDFFGGDIPWLVSGDVNRGEIYDCEGRITEEGLKNSNCKILPENSVLIALNGQGKTRGTLAILRTPSACNQSLVAIIPFSLDILKPEYLLLSLRLRYREIRDITGQTQRRGLNMGLVSNLSIPVAPINEQRRIVAKVDELMALCDKLETQQKKRKALCKLTRKAVVNDFAIVQNSEALSRAWNRIQENFNLWLDDEDAITGLRNTVEFLGCRGLLTESSPFNVNKSNGKIVPLPTEWSWKTLKQLSEYITSGSRGWKRFVAPLGDRFIRSQDIKYDSLVFEDPVFVVLPEQVEGMRTLVRPGDLLMTITGANVGKCALVPQLTKKAYVSQHVALIRLRDIRHTPFLHWWITNTFGGRNYLAQYIYGVKPGLNLAQVGNIPIPFPPQEVQDRIVETLEHYRILFDRLSVQVSEAQNVAESLAAAAIASITGIQVENKEKMKAPKTELVSTLRIGVSPTNREQAPLAAILIRNNGEMPAKTLWQASGFEIDAFYRQLKAEMSKGWIVQPGVAHMREMEVS
jgi:type I restriction enzyme, S subunit